MLLFKYDWSTLAKVESVLFENGSEVGGLGRPRNPQELEERAMELVDSITDDVVSICSAGFRVYKDDSGWTMIEYVAGLPSCGTFYD